MSHSSTYKPEAWAIAAETPNDPTAEDRYFKTTMIPIIVVETESEAVSLLNLLKEQIEPTELKLAMWGKMRTPLYAAQSAIAKRLKVVKVVPATWRQDMRR